MVAANLPAAGDSRRAFEDELARIAAGDTHPPAETGKAGDSHVATEPAESTRRMPTCQPTIRELPNGQRPRERLRELGPQALNQAELLAILLRTWCVNDGLEMSHFYGLKLNHLVFAQRFGQCA